MGAVMQPPVALRVLGAKRIPVLVLERLLAASYLANRVSGLGAPIGQRLRPLQAVEVLGALGSQSRGEDVMLAVGGVCPGQVDVRCLSYLRNPVLYATVIGDGRLERR